jgi:hypothetical protein
MAKNDVIIFGVSQLASPAHFYFRHDSDYKVVALLPLTRTSCNQTPYEGLPVIPFEKN